MIALCLHPGPCKPTGLGHLLEPGPTSEIFTPHESPQGSWETADSLAESLPWKHL